MPVEARPAAAEDLFGDRLELAERLTGHLVSSGVERGLVGPREVERIWTRHVLNCAVLTELLPQGARVVDVGSGAGLPGLVVAVARADLDVVLVEPLQRRVTWLEEVVADLGLGVAVVRARAEEVAGAVTGDVVTARAVAPLGRLLGWGLPLAAPGGQVLAIKGRSARDELEEAGDVLARWGTPPGEVLTCGSGLLEEPTTVVRVWRGTGPAPSDGRTRPARVRDTRRRPSDRGPGGRRPRS